MPDFSEFQPSTFMLEAHLTVTQNAAVSQSLWNSKQGLARRIQVQRLYLVTCLQRLRPQTARWPGTLVQFESPIPCYCKQALPAGSADSTSRQIGAISWQISHAHGLHRHLEVLLSCWQEATCLRMRMQLWQHCSLKTWESPNLW